MVTPVERLTAAIRSEERLLESLRTVLERQGAAVSTDDLVLLDDSVFAAQRVLLTLAEARRNRRTLLGIVAGEEDLHLAQLDDVMGDQLTPDLRTARDHLQATAGRLARTLERNRRLLGGALDAGDRLIRALCGAPAQNPVYGASGCDGQAGGTLLIDRQA